MNIRNKIPASLICVAAAGLSIAWATSPASEISVLHGTAQVKQSDGTWADSSSIAPGSWVRPSKADATLRLPGMTLRMEKGASVQVPQAGDGPARLQARGGRVYVKVDAGTPGCVVSTTTKNIHALESEFVVDAGIQEKFYAIGGQVSVVNESPSPRSLAAWSRQSSSQIALDGPDVRKRNNNRKRFTQGEENKGKRIGEDLPPKTPIETQSPAYTPSATPTYTPTATPKLTPSPTPSSTPQLVEEGFDPWPLIGGVLGAGGIAALVILNNDDDDDNRVIFPASP